MMYLPGTLPAQWRPNEDSVPRFLPSPQRVGAEKGLLSFFLSVHVTTPLLVQHLKCLCQHHWEKCPPQRKGDRPRFPEMEMPAHVGPAEAQAPVTFGDLAIYFSLEECGRLAPCRRICTKTSCWRTTSTWSLSTWGLNVRPRSYVQIIATNLSNASIRNQFLQHQKAPQEREAARKIQS